MLMNVYDHVIKVTVIAPQERIDAFCAPELRDMFDTMIGQGTTRFVVDLSAVPFLDSAGLAVLVRLLKRSRQVGGDIRMILPQEEAARRILHLTKFDHVFPLSDSVDNALRSFA